MLSRKTYGGIQAATFSVIHKLNKLFVLNCSKNNIFYLPDVFLTETNNFVQSFFFECFSRAIFFDFNNLTD